MMNGQFLDSRHYHFKVSHHHVIGMPSFSYHLYISKLKNLIMRTSISVILVLSVFIYSCSKSSNNPAPPVVSGSITITGISPAMPYADDEITITGTGFNPDKTKDTVDFGTGDPVSGIFGPHASGLTTASKAIVISASATQLVIKAVNPDSTFGLDYQLFKRTNIGFNAFNRIRVRSVGLKAISNLTPFKQLPYLELVGTAYNGTWQANNIFMAPNDSVAVRVYGVTNNNVCDIKISLSCSKSLCSFVDNYLNYNGTSPQCDCTDFGTIVYGCGGTVFQGKLISYNTQLRIADIDFLVPANFFGTPVNTVINSRILIKMQATNAEGKSTSKPMICWTYPSH